MLLHVLMAVAILWPLHARSRVRGRGRGAPRHAAPHARAQAAAPVRAAPPRGVARASSLRSNPAPPRAGAARGGIRDRDLLRPVQRGAARESLSRTTPSCADGLPCIAIERSGNFVVSRYSDVLYVLRHPELFSSSAMQTMILSAFVPGAGTPGMGFSGADAARLVELMRELPISLPEVLGSRSLIAIRSAGARPHAQPREPRLHAAPDRRARAADPRDRARGARRRREQGRVRPRRTTSRSRCR